MIEFTFELADLLTVGGAIVVAVLVGLWARNALKDWRWTPWVVLAVAMGIMVAVDIVVEAGNPTWSDVVKALLLAGLGVSLETFGYETILNALGAAGLGKRSEGALLDRARAMVARAEFDLD